jgi:hypothetical protein
MHHGPCCRLGILVIRASSPQDCAGELGEALGIGAAIH